MDRKMNKAVVRRMIKRLENVPEGYNQSTHYITSSDIAPCGTVACLAGEAVICSVPKLKDGIALALHEKAWGSVSDRASELLGLPNRVHGIFYADASGWPAPFASDYATAPKESRAQVAVAYLKEALKRGTMIW